MLTFILLHLGELTFWNVQGGEEMEKIEHNNLTEIEKGEEGIKKILKLVKEYRWKLEDATKLDLFYDVANSICVITNFKAGSKLSYSRKNKINEEFRNDIATILEEFDLEIEEFVPFDDKNKGYHTIEMTFRRSNKRKN